MTLENFFSLTEMKDGLTAPARVEELVSLLKKERDSLVKNVGDTARQWASVASTIAATENKEYLDLFVKLDGLRFIDRWLKDAQTISKDGNDSVVEEAISALLLAVAKLQIDKERLISSGICITVKNLLIYSSTRVQDRARTLVDDWKAVDVDLVSMDVEKSAFCGDPILNNEYTEFQSDANDVSSLRSLEDQKLEHVEVKMMKTSNDQCRSQKPLDHTDSEGKCPDTITSPVTLKCVEGDISVREEVSPYDGKVDPPFLSDLKQVAVEASSQVVKSEHVAGDASHDNIIESLRDRLVKVEVSSASIPSNNGLMDAKEADTNSELDTNDAKDDLSVKRISSDDANWLVGESRNEMDCSGSLEQKGLDQGEGCSALEETKDQGTSTSKLEDVGIYSEAKRRNKNNRQYFGNSCEFARLTKSSKNNDIIRQTNMDLEDGTVDALEVACFLAKEVEREVMGYDEQSDSSSSDETISKGSTRRPESPESINGEDPEINAPSNNLLTMDNVYHEPSKKEHITDSTNQETILENHTQDLESSQVTDAQREPEVNTERSVCEFDLNQEFSSEDLDHHVDTISNPVSIVSASTAVMVPRMPAGPAQFGGTLGWKGSAATSAFRPASPHHRASDSEKALSGGGTSSGSRQRQGFLDFDLNVAEGGADKIINPMPGKQNTMLPDQPSGESSVELSPKRYEMIKIDLNQSGEDGDVLPSGLKMFGKILGPQDCRRSPSPASSSSCMQPLMRNFDLNDNLYHTNNLSNPHPFLSESSSHKTSSYVGPADDSVVSIMGVKVKKNVFPPQTPLPFLNRRTSEPLMDTRLLRGGSLVGLGPGVPYPQSVYNYNGLGMGPVVSFPSGLTYGPSGPIPYMFDSRGTPVMPQLLPSSSAVPSSYCQPPLMMNMMMGSSPGSNVAGSLRPNVDLNSGFAAVEGGNRDPGFFRQFLVPGHGRPLEEQQRDNFGPISSGTSTGKRKEPDTGWEIYASNYKHHQPPHL